MFLINTDKIKYFDVAYPIHKVQYRLKLYYAIVLIVDFHEF